MGVLPVLYRVKLRGINFYQQGRKEGQCDGIVNRWQHGLMEI